MWQDYVAVNAGMILRVMGRFAGQQIEMPAWTELAYPEHEIVDTRSPDQIKADVLKGLLGA